VALTPKPAREAAHGFGEPDGIRLASVQAVGPVRLGVSGTPECAGRTVSVFVSTKMGLFPGDASAHAVGTRGVCLILSGPSAV